MSEVLSMQSTFTNDTVSKTTAQYDADFVLMNAGLNKTVRDNLQSEHNYSFVAVSILKTAYARSNLFVVDTARNAVYEQYLAHFEQPLKQYNNCYCCKSYIRAFGNTVFLDHKGEIKSLLWNEDNVPEDYKESVKHMRLLVEGSVIKDRFISNERKLKFYLQGYKTGGFSHFKVDHDLILYKDQNVSTINLSQSVKMLEASYVKYVGLKVDNQFVIDKVLTLFEHHASLKTRPSFKKKLQQFKDIVDVLKTAKEKGYNRKNIIYYYANNLTPDIFNIKNTVLGELLDTIATGEDNVAILNFIAMTKSEVYMRSTEAPKVGNVDQAKKIFDELGITPAFKRRFMTPEELNALSCNIWKTPVLEDKTKTATEALFENIAPRKVENTPSIIDGGRIPIMDFITKHLPEATKVELVFNQTMNAIVGSAQTAVDPDSLPIYRYDKMDNRKQYGSWVTNSRVPLTELGLNNNTIYEVTNIAPHTLLAGIEDPSEDPALTFVLKDKKYYQSKQLCIFSEVTIPELYPVRSAVEALSNAGTKEGIENSFLGIVIPKDNFNIVLGISVYITTNTAKIKYSF